MKSSRYNYILNIDDKNVLFNGLTLKILELNENLKLDLNKILNNPHKYLKKYPTFINVLYENNFIIDDGIDEVGKVKDLKLESLSRPKYTLTILPTYNCNLSCWYCVQNHNKEIMAENIVNSIKKNIYNHIKDNYTEVVELHWFGGEPLICLEKQILEISQYAIKLCKENNIEFFNNITTNGYLINEKRSHLLNELNFKQFQITIDGDRETHNKTRNHHGLPTFDRILNNVKLLLDTISEVKIFLRFNFTDTNLYNIDLMIEQLNQIIPSEYRSRIQINPVKVWQINKDKIHSNSFDKIQNLFKENGYSLANVELNTDFLICDYEQKYSHVIFHNGNVDKCNNIPPDKAHYKLDEEGNIVNIKKEGKIIDIFSLKCKCSQCKHLPICLGPCLRWLRETGDLENFKCVDEFSDHNNMEKIISYCRTQILMNN